jgi:hypothetical protein
MTMGWFWIATVCGLFAGVAAKNKGLSFLSFFIMGFVVPPVGVLVALMVKPQPGH